MKRATRLVLLAAIALAFPGTAAAQDEAVPAAATATPILDTPVTFQPAPVRTKRRGSMVGYIEDSTIATQFRVRFDAGWGNNRPDRAEFFYAKCGCYIFDAPPFGDLDAPGPGPGVPTQLEYKQFYIFGEYAVSERFSVFGEVPFRGIEPDGFLDFGPPYDPFEGESGLGDIRAGAKLGLMSRSDRNATLLVRAGFPSGDAAKGLGSDLFSIEPALLYSQAINDRVGLEAQFGLWLPFGGSAGVDSDDKFSGQVLYYGIGPSFDLVATDRARFTPVVELVGWRVINGFQTGCNADLTCTYDADDNIVSLKFGARTTVNERHSFYVGYGVPLTDAQWYSKILRFEYRFGR